MPVDMINNPHHEPVNGAMNNNLRDIMDVTYHVSTYALEDIPPPPLTDDLIIDVNKDAQGQLHKNSEVASSQYGVNIFIVGLFLMLAVYLKIIRLTESNRLTFLVVLMLIQVVWMTFYICVSDRKKWASTEKDGHAGARWLRCGIVLFAATTIVMHALKLGYFVGYSECLPIIEGIYPVTHNVHTFFQVYFLWCHSKDVIKSFKTLERFGLIHSVFTNLLLWASAVATESEHQLEEHMGRLRSLGFVNITLNIEHLECNCTTNLCKEFKKGIYYIYPFNIEYQILASAMLYVLWKNIGNKTDYSQHKTTLKLNGVLTGSILGLIVLAATIGVVVAYLLNIGLSKTNSEMALSVYYFYSIPVLSLMCIGSLLGLVMYKIERKPVVKEKSPSVKLDADMLVGSAIGSWIVSWGSILAIICAETNPAYTWYNLPYSILVIIEKYIQNLFIITYINRRGQDDLKATHIDIPIGMGQISVPAESTEFTWKGLEVKQHDSLQHKQSTNDKKQKPPANLKIQNFKKSLLKNITVLLFLCNISLWILPAFGCRPQYDNGLEATVFGILPWIIIIDVALPFSIFYRMHSAYSLFDVYCNI
ncbi:proton channel OTOP1-like [Rana temporaria]|uniref:proton channel OTOP1-like n=1 Tax=Rana temporaria TaxID=8407 RepID=UPI001AADECE5|nr:proton channel OTOP1-like [Rana temporaria]